MYSAMATSLNQFTRATTIAQGYQFYRITNIKLRIKAPYDTFVNANPTQGQYQKPYMYYMIDKAGSVPSNVTLEGLKQMGAKPIAMDEKAITISWKPSVLEFAATAASAGIGLPNRYRLSPWLTTQNNVVSAPWAASQVDHLGIYYGVFSALAGAADPITYDVEMEVQFQFKKPLVHTAVGSNHATPVVFATQNDSTDGIVGGPDGV